MPRHDSQVVLYGIRNCDTVRKARGWLERHSIEYQFHDYKLLGTNIETLEYWCAVLGWENVINRSGTTFKKLAAEDREFLDLRRAIKLMSAQPSMIRRPILSCPEGLLAGLNPDSYALLLLGKKL